MLQIKDWIFLLVLSVCRRSVDKCTTLSVCTWRVEQNLMNIAMRNVLKSVEVLVVGRDFDTALPTYRTVVVLSTWIVECTAIDSQVVVVETFVHRTIGCTFPNTILVLAEHCTATSAES